MPSLRAIRFVVLAFFARLVSCEAAAVEGPFGVDAAVDVMVPMRDGTRLATDIYRPTRQGRPLEDRRPIVLVRKGKGGKSREVPLGGAADRAVITYLPARLALQASDAALFVNAAGERLTPRSVQRMVKRWTIAGGVHANATPHGLRHSFATHLLDEGTHERSRPSDGFLAAGLMLRPCCEAAGNPLDDDPVRSSRFAGGGGRRRPGHAR